MAGDVQLQVGPCTVEEMPALSDLLDEVFIKERAGTGTLFNFAPLLYNEANVENLRVVRMQGRIVGHAGICVRPIRWRGQVLQAGLIGGVCARQDLRGLGIGTLAMRDVAEHMAALGLDFGVLWTGSHHFYERLGWRHAGGLSRVNVAAGEREVARGMTVAPLAESGVEIAACHALHAAAMRNEVIRTLDETVAVTCNREVLVALHGGELAGYAAVTGSTVRELEGAAEACVALLAHVAREQDAMAVMPLHDPRIAPILSSLNAERVTGPLGMCLIVSRESLLGKIEAQLGRPAEQFGVTDDLDDPAAMQVVFGDHTDPWTGDLPLAIFIDYADHV